MSGLSLSAFYKDAGFLLSSRSDSPENMLYADCSELPRLDLGKFICGTGRGSSETQADRKQGTVCVLSNCGNELAIFCPN